MRDIEGRKKNAQHTAALTSTSSTLTWPVPLSSHRPSSFSRYTLTRCSAGSPMAAPAGRPRPAVHQLLPPLKHRPHRLPRPVLPGWRPLAEWRTCPSKFCSVWSNQRQSDSSSSSSGSRSSQHGPAPATLAGGKGGSSLSARLGRIIVP